jgi:DNA polymerase-3 subunit delta
MKTIDSDIKNKTFAPIYLLYGEEVYLKRQYQAKLKQALSKDGDTMNAAQFEGKGAVPSEIIDLAETMPFFAERRIILIENSGYFKSPCEELAQYLKDMTPTTHIIFVEEEIDKRGKMYKSVKANGRIIEFSRQNEKILSQWILTRLKKENKKIVPNIMQLFLDMVGNDMENIDKELEKLICYTQGREIIEEADVKAIVTQVTTNRIFELLGAISEKDQQKALNRYHDLLALKEPPMRIIFLLARQFRILAQIKEMSQKKLVTKQIAATIGLPEFAVKRNVLQSQKFNSAQLRQAVTDCIETEEAVKTGNLNDRLGVELLIIKYTT